MTTVRHLAQRHPEVWRAATHDPFLDGARTGSLPTEVFDRWLEQDRLFVEALARAWGTLLALAPAQDLALLADGIGAFVAEMAWFEDLAAQRGLAIPAHPLPAAVEYHAHLAAVVQEPYAVALSAMWTVEAAYLEAWRSALPGAPAYRPFVEHWTDPAFVAFVDRLEAAADRALACASTAEIESATAAVATTAEHEAAFWAMSRSDGTQGVTGRALVLVRHAEVHADASEPAAQWRITEQGRSASRALAAAVHRRHSGIAAIATSNEIKAVETATELAHGLRATGLHVQVAVDHRLREVGRPWTDDHGAYKALVARYLAGEEPTGWEPRDAVVERLSAALHDLTNDGPALAVSHGIAMTVWLASVTTDLDAIGFWTGLRFPDAWVVQRDEGTLQRFTA